MLKEKVHRIPVVNERQQVIGKISKFLLLQITVTKTTSEMRINFLVPVVLNSCWKIQFCNA
jgi:flagellar assembly factor FliW